MTDAFTWPSPLLHSLKCFLKLSLRKQLLLPVLDVFSVSWVGIHHSQGAAAELLLAKMIQDQAYSS